MGQRDVHGTTRAPLRRASIVGLAPWGAARRLAPVLGRLFGGPPPVRIEFWDGSWLGREGATEVVRVNSKQALSRLAWSPGELGLARSYVTGELEVDGDLFTVLAVMQGALTARRADIRDAVGILWAALRLGAFGSPPTPPAEEVRLWGGRHSKRRDAEAISYHYDVGNDFYRLVLGDAMTYSCARFADDDYTLEQAQRAKHDLVCRKLGLHEGQPKRLLDVGCGWGSMAIHAAGTYGASVLGITLSAEQADAARARVRAAALQDLIEIRLCDYRELRGETFDAISSIGMFEHVGHRHMGEYFSILHQLLGAKGRLLNHAISTPGSSTIKGRRFINRYVFPDGELIDVANVVAAMERSGFEVRDVESLREHYARTLSCWVENLDGSWEKAVSFVGEARARVWRLYMAAAANAFAQNKLAIHQVLGVVPEAGSSGMPPTRRLWD